ncbi:hypothetical protein LBBP_00697 [Leptospira borgpetersenii serovar Ballum]|uniref:Uncharacterized protein n=1 Tax=Leptospira borgpetersenii serovar Ballum TaxID=280505 RepID=A0A0S2IN56_LEPBO|nr:hypothetical protein LBBP_00697 [Leptospira borgpetersenii serovar Ballum]
MNKLEFKAFMSRNLVNFKETFEKEKSFYFRILNFSSP